ncbi:MAG: tetratricopeptide repeat protein, partial [Nostoc sp. C3-bin3]|nr:tetratricopeptide repeat protein [Nostoc sp. C3-bin3]
MTLKCKLKPVLVHSFSCIPLAILIIGSSISALANAQTISPFPPPFPSLEERDYQRCLDRSSNCIRPPLNVPKPKPSTQKSELQRLIGQATSDYNNRRFSVAEEKFRQLIKKFPKYPLLYYQLGNALIGQGKAEEAVSQYQQAIRLDPDYAVAHNGIGVTRARQFRWKEAIEEYQKALIINPIYADALKNLGEALWHQGKPIEATASLKKARNL